MATLQDKLIRHQIYLEGLKAGQAAEFAPILKGVEADVRKALLGISYENMGELNRAQLSKLVASLRKTLLLRYTRYTDSLIQFLRRFMGLEFEMMRSIFASADNGEDGLPTTEDKDIEGLPLLPISKGGKTSEDLTALWWPRVANSVLPANGIVLQSFVNALSLAAVTTIINRVTQGAAQHDSVRDTLGAVIGEEGYRKRLTAQARAVLATAMQSVSAQSQAAFAPILGFSEYEWISILDDRTSNICRSRSGLRFIYGKGPLPPAHPNCRSHIEPVVAGRPIANPSFTEWVANQPATMRQDMFGVRQPTGKFENAQTITTLDEFGSKITFIIA